MTLPPSMPPPSFIPAALVEAYRETDYFVAAHATAAPIALRVDEYSEPLATLHARAGVASSVFVTAWNPYSRLLDDATNLSRQAALQAALIEGGVETLPAKGVHRAGEWPPEPGVLALGLSLATARRWGERFNQNAIVFAAADAVPRLILLLATESPCR